MLGVPVIFCLRYSMIFLLFALAAGMIAVSVAILATVAHIMKDNKFRHIFSCDEDRGDKL